MVMRLMLVRNFGFGLLVALMLGCTAGPDIKDGASTGALPAMGWDARPESAQWTTATLAAVARHDSVLAGAIPADIATWCPGYPTAGLVDRRAFWVAVLSALAKPESSWNPAASGDGGRYIGLTQISPRTASANGCEATSVTALKDGAANLRCAVKIMARQVGQDGVVAGTGRQGLGRDWGPFNKAEQRAQMAGWTSRQSYCQAT